MNAQTCDALRDFYNLKNVKNTHGEVLLLVKLQAKTFNFTKSNIPPWVFFTFFKLYKFYQNAQSVSLEIETQSFDCDYLIGE